MLAYIIRRIAHLVPVLFVLTVSVFVFVEMLPGNIVDTLIGTEGNDDPEIRAALEKEYGLDQPVHVRYAKWLGRVVQGDFGISLVTRRPVTLELMTGIPATVYLATVGIGVSMLIAVPLGTIAAVRRNSGVDYTAQVTSLAGISVPEFVTATVLLIRHMPQRDGDRVSTRLRRRGCALEWRCPAEGESLPGNPVQERCNVARVTIAPDMGRLQRIKTDQDDVTVLVLDRPIMGGLRSGWLLCKPRPGRLGRTASC